MEENITIFILLTLAFLIQDLYGYSHCWDGVNGGMYYGTLSITKSGKECQKWADQTPQSHTYTDDAKFPFDGSVAGANNYCRDPDFNYRPWCYTMDPFDRWDECDVPICTNLPCGVGVLTGASNPAILSASIDTNSGINYLATDTSYQLECCGSIEKWKFYIKKAGTVRLQIWRHDSATGNYVLRGENTFTYSVAQENAIHEETISQADRISVTGGDIIGWYTSADDMISYASGAANGNLLLATLPSAPTVGQSVSFSSATVEDSRNYAIGVAVAQNLSPYFTNSGNTATTTDKASVGTPVFDLSVTDDDPDHVASLTVTMTTSSTYFELNPTTLEIQIKSTLAVGTFALDFEVKDDCDEKGIFTVTITVSRTSVNINNLPDFGSVSESETTETLVFTLAFDSTGPHTCTMDSYLPTRTEGNPFLVKPTPSSDIGVYLKASAAVRYNIATSYDVTISCNDGSTSDTKVLTVNILPNSQPTFQSWTGAVTISAPTTPNGQVVYTATVNDAESDPIAMAISTCTPLPCPFDINNDKEIFATEDLYLHEVSGYDIYLTADDGFNTVTSSLLTITITDLNEKPVFTNLGGTQNVLEDTPVGDAVFQVSQYDGNGDTPTFSASYAPAACATLFALDSSDGRITTLASLDYETVAVTSCVLTVTVNDGKVNSDQDTVTLAIIDLDEPPIFSSNSYTISSPEVTDGTVLPDPGITVTDPESTAVTLSLNCGTDTGYLSIDSGTKLLTMVTAYDVDPSLSSYSINCFITASDATSQTTTTSLTVEITDANDETPTFTAGMYTINIMNTQGLGVIGSVSASDADSTSPNNLITYTLSGSTKYIIDASGNVELVGDVTADTGITPYMLTATATDGGAGPLSSTAIVQVLVSDAAAVTTTTTTTTAATTVVGSSDSGFFSSTLNIIWFTLAIALGTFVLVTGGYLLYRLCRSKTPTRGEKTRYSQNQNDLQKENPTKQTSENKGIRKRSLSDSNKRPASNDSGINISLRTPTPPNTRFQPTSATPYNIHSQPIAVQPAEDVFTSDSTVMSQRTNNLTMQDIRQWKLEQGQWRQALLAGRLKY